MTEFPTEEMLNAYVDGELSPADDARVAEAIAQDSNLATRVAHLSRIKSALAELSEHPPRAIQFPRNRWSKAALAVAASFGLMVAIASVLLTGLLNLGPQGDNWYQLAAATHAEWAREPASPSAKEVDANLYLASIDRLNLQVHAPDLTSAKLRLTYLKFHQANEETQAAMHLGYTGRRGCRLTLWVTRAPLSMNTDLVESREGKLRSFRWRVGKIAYALFATGMAEQRYAMIADKVYQATRVRHGFDEETRMALNEATRNAPPCSA